MTQAGQVGVIVLFHAYMESDHDGALQSHSGDGQDS
jgi:hypothetical protein